VDSEKQSVMAVGQQVLDAVVDALKTHPDDEATVGGACFALKNFTFEQSNIRALCKMDGIFGLLLAQSERYEDGAIVLERLQLSTAEDASLEDSAVDSLNAIVVSQSEEPKIIEDVLETMKSFDWSAKVTAACLRSLSSLASCVDSHKTAIKTDDFYKRLCDFIQVHKADLIVQEEARALMNLLNDEQNEDKSAPLEKTSLRDQEAIWEAHSHLYIEYSP
jgi:hypothetical protein